MPVKFVFNRKVQTASLIILSLIFIILSVQTFGKAMREGGYDFTSYLLSSKAFWVGQNPYITNSPFPYTYPLFLAVVLVPLAYIPYEVSNLIFLLVNIFCFFFIFYFIIKLYADEKVSLINLILPALVLTIFLLQVIQNNLLNGQINIVVLFLTVLFLIFYLKNKRVEASIFLSLAVSIKLTPLIFVFFLLKRKEYIIILLTVLFSFLFIFGIPYLIRGNNSIEAYQFYFSKLKELSFAESLNQQTKIFTLNGFLGYIIPFVSGNIIFKYLCAIVIVSVLFLLDKAKSGNKNEIITFGIYSASILLISPMSETHHIIMILPALSLIMYFLFFKKIFLSVETYILILFVVTFLTATFLKVGLFYFVSFVLLICFMFIQKRNSYER